jgi:DNA-binding winged helix-turn-helix (wHTH) protein
VILAFGDFELDEDLYALRRRGRQVKLEPKVFDVLHFLLRRRARVVTKEELLDALWPGEAVSESVLPRCIAAARRAVGDTRGRRAVIQTLHGRGYRFVASVTETAGARDAVPPQPTRTPFVGRASLMAALGAALDDAAAGRLRVVLLAGEPGIGKTRVLGALGPEAAARGARWLEGRCHEAEGAPAFWPWVQVLRGLVSDAPVSALAADLGAGAPDVAELLPELRRKLPRLARPDDPGSDQARFRLFDAVAAFLARAAARRPLAVALDDLHWSDPDSLRLVDFLARTYGAAPILLVGTYRDVEVRRDRPLARLLGDLAGRSGVERLELRGLDADAVGELVAAVAGAAGRGVSAALAERTGGNPFFVLELIRLLADEGRLAAAGALCGLVLPQGVRDAIGRRLDRLSPECNETLRAAAVTGRRFELPVLEAVAGRPREVLLERLAEAEAAGLVAPSGEGTGRFAFSHALIHQALYEELSLPRRVALHRRAGETLATRYTGRVDAPAAEIAHHFFESSMAGEAGRAVDWCERAAEQALALCAYDEGVRHLARALEAEDHGDRDDARRCALLVRLGEARWAAGDREGGRACLADAAELARAIRRDDLFARAAVGHRGVGEMGVPPDARTLALLEEARVRAGDDAPATRARVLARLAGTPPYARSMGTREELAREAWALARRADDAEALGDAIGARYWATLGPDRIDERLAVAEDARALAERSADRSLAAVAAEIALGAHLLRGDRAAADRELARYVRLAEDTRRPVFRMLASAALASRASDAGEFAVADAHLVEAGERARGSVPYADAVCTGQRLWLAFQRGDPIRMDDLALAAPLTSGFGAMEAYAGLLRVLALLVSDDALAVGRELDEIARAGFDDLERDEGWMFLMTMLAIAVSRHRDVSRAEILYAKLLPLRHLMVSHDLMRSVAGSVELPLALLALARSRPGDAVTHLMAAQERERAMGLGPALVRSGLGLALALDRRGEPGDAERAARARAEAEAASARLGMRLAGLIPWGGNRA